jgi:hypothetical protein
MLRMPRPDNLPNLGFECWGDATGKVNVILFRQMAYLPDVMNVLSYALGGNPNDQLKAVPFQTTQKALVEGIQSGSFAHIDEGTLACLKKIPAKFWKEEGRWLLPIKGRGKLRVIRQGEFVTLMSDRALLSVR